MIDDYCDGILSQIHRFVNVLKVLGFSVSLIFFGSMLNNFDPVYVNPLQLRFGFFGTFRSSLFLNEYGFLIRTLTK